MYLKFWGVREDGEYSPKKGAPRPAWTYRYARRNAARLAHWPNRMRWRRVPLAVKETIWARIKAMLAPTQTNQMA